MTIITSPANLWRNLYSSAGLELRLKGGRPGRDADVEDSLRLALAVPKTAQSLEAWLISDAASPQPKVSTEQLLIEVLKSQGGFAQMMQDILEVLITAEAQQTSHQLSVEFKFDNITDPIKATLEQFREAVDRTRSVLGRRPKLPNDNLMWSLAEVFHSFLKTRPEHLPSDFPPVSPITPTGDAGIDERLARLTRLVSDFRTLWMRHGTTRKQVNLAAGTLTNADSDKQTLSGQLFAAGDYWDVGVLKGAQEMSRQVVSGQLSVQNALEKMDGALNGIEAAEEVWADQTIQELINVLNLPAWRHRHELYSVWVGTRMLRVVECVVPDMRFHPVDGVLSFEFGGSRLATFSWGKKQFDIWAELRSTLVGRSSKRKRGIQPDFRVLKVDLSKSVNAQTIYVLECKHYLNVSTSNFTQAATDYARSCPNAIVHVVNHGTTDEAALTAALHVELQSRARFIGSATPLLQAKNQALSNAIRETLFPGLPLPIPVTLVSVSPNPTLTPIAPATVCYVNLEWDASLDDMDLSLQVIGNDGQAIHSIDFRDTGELDASPFARLGDDDRYGPGIERIDISAWHFSRYELIATNYSQSGQMTPQALSCNIVTETGSTRLRCIEGLASTCYKWKIAELVVNNGILAISPCN